MRCPYCYNLDDKVIDSRESQDGEVIRRRRECTKCGRRFTTYERLEQLPYMVIKKDGRREPFDRRKVLAGLMKACEKRPVSTAKLEEITNEAEKFVQRSKDRECPTQQIGELIMCRLKSLDKVAFVRFASVYKDFKDVSEFLKELKALTPKPKMARKKRAARQDIGLPESV
ncbi:MAG: transcriptional regulator NrdR [Acidobacteriota bacterium]|nr:transcriptional regulator NrdR [Blastocatellia bacterium]MDW8411766.1 transcriptional regulator NrdR [Acidobacteriota bacterium]